MNKNLPKPRVILVFLILMGYNLGELTAQLSLTNLGATTTIDFESTVNGVTDGAFSGAGFASSTSSGQLDSDAWSTDGFGDDVAFGSTCTSGDCSRGADDGNVSTGGIYSFDTGGGNSSLGVQPGGSDFTPGSITLRVINNIGSTFTTLTVSYDIYVHNDQGRANSLNFSYSTNGSSFIDLPALDFTSPEASTGDAWSTATNRNISFSLTINNGDDFFLRWTGADETGSGSRDEFAIDDISISGSVSLPIELADFRATAKEDFVALEWLVLSELNNDFMAVERSADGHNFVELGIVKGRGTTNEPTQYTFQDLSPIAGENYYRLRQVDFDGKMNYSNLEIVEWNKNEPEVMLYPTVVQDQFTLRFPQGLNNSNYLEIYDLTGRSVFQSNINAENRIQNFNISLLPKGTYLLKVERLEKVVRFIKN